ncbi:MAG TPA: BlaI/MecI/CopY family transcriptional regulator [Bryobacteraceae bacterium]|nr:BlaI/MecI/CopY family transcriptional regulator [Bryobacteraceae bacterium]
MKEITGVSRRERQILDVLFRKKEATAMEIQAEMPEAPSYSAVRALLRILEEKGHVKHREVGQRYVYLPVVEVETASRSALRHVLDTFFEGSAAGAMAALLGDDGGRLTKDELDRMEALLAKARKGGRS